MLELARTDRRTDRQNDYCNPRCACAPRVNKSLSTPHPPSRYTHETNSPLAINRLDHIHVRLLNWRKGNIRAIHKPFLSFCRSLVCEPSLEIVSCPIIYYATSQLRKWVEWKCLRCLVHGLIPYFHKQQGCSQRIAFYGVLDCHNYKSMEVGTRFKSESSNVMQFVNCNLLSLSTLEHHH